MYDICCIGHITLDKVVTPQRVVYMAGGTSVYFSNGIHNMGLSYHLITAIAETEISFVTELRSKQIGVTVLPSKHTVSFENIYQQNQDHRVQNVLQKSDPFLTEQLGSVEAEVFHLGPLLADDMTVELIQMLAQKGKVSLDVQGFLREVKNQKVFAKHWTEKMQALRHIHFLKANEQELEMLTGETDIRKGAMLLAHWGVAEVVLTLGSKGSVIYHNGNFEEIPAYKPSAVIDATGCGDTYMAGYLARRIQGDDVNTSGRFAAAMATLKIQASGPFTGTAAEVHALVSGNNSFSS